MDQSQNSQHPQTPNSYPPNAGQQHQQHQSYHQQQQPPQQLYIPGSLAGDLPAMVRNELARLSPQKQAEFLEEYKRNKKSVGAAYALWFFLGWHYAYQRKWGLQFLYWFTAGGVFVWTFID